jgi:hypothetical protein
LTCKGTLRQVFICLSSVICHLSFTTFLFGVV